MAGVAQMYRCPQDPLPGHFLHMIVQRHGVGHQFKAVLQGTVMLAVEIFPTIPVGDLHELPGALVVLSGAVDLQLHAEVAHPRSAELGFRLVIVVLNCTASCHTAIASVADRVVVIFVLIIGVTGVDDPPAAVAYGVVPVVAGLAEGGVFIPGLIVPINALSAVGTDHGLLVCAALTQFIVPHRNQAFQRVGLSTVTAGKGFSHHRQSP